MPANKGGILDIKLSFLGDAASGGPMVISWYTELAVGTSDLAETWRVYFILLQFFFFFFFVSFGYFFLILGVS
jgi:hypothetical protein